MNVPAFKTQRGFSFTEVMISLFVLSVGFLGVASLATSTLRSSFEQRDTAIATLLAQEGVELVFNIRDTNIAKGVDEFDPPSSENDVKTGPDGSKIDYASVEFSNCNTPDQCRLSLISGFYLHDNAGAQTKFARKVKIVEPDLDTREVEVMVYWGSEGFPDNATACSSDSKCVVVMANLFR